MQVVPDDILADQRIHLLCQIGEKTSRVQTTKLFPNVTFMIIGASDYRQRFSDPRTLLIIGHCLYLTG